MPIQIDLTQGKVALIDEADWDLVRGYRWYAYKSRNTFYAKTNVRSNRGGRRQRQILMHRLLIGLTDPKVQVDHRDGDGLNNRRENLRACTHAENRRNTGAYANNKSGFKGVHWREDCGKWRAEIGVNGKLKHLGHYDSPIDAYAAYCAAAKELHGEFTNVG